MELSSLNLLLQAIFIVSTLLHNSSTQILNPPYFNLAEGSTITATATCGVNVTTSKERFCRLTGASADERQQILNDRFHNLYYTGNSQIIAGQLCDDCFDENNPNALSSNVHPARYAIDGTERWWQSPPLSRGSQYNNVNLTIDLGQVCIWLRFLSIPRFRPIFVMLSAHRPIRLSDTGR